MIKVYLKIFVAVTTARFYGLNNVLQVLTMSSRSAVNTRGKRNSMFNIQRKDKIQYLQEGRGVVMHCDHWRAA